MEIFYKDGIYSLEIKAKDDDINRSIITMYDIDGNVIWSCEDCSVLNMRMARKILQDWTARNLIDFDVMDEKELTLYGILMEEF